MVRVDHEEGSSDLRGLALSRDRPHTEAARCRPGWRRGGRDGRCMIRRRCWAGVCAELGNRGGRDVLIVCCDGLPEAIEATRPDSTVQTCVVHLIRAGLPFVSYGDRKAVAAALRPVYTAPTAEAALAAFAGSPLGGRYPATVAVWERPGSDSSRSWRSRRRSGRSSTPPTVSSR